MKVCDLTTLYIDGGAGGVNTYLEEKARFFEELGGSVEHTVIIPARRTERRKLHGSSVHAIRSPRLPWNSEHRVIVNFRAVRAILQREAPDVIEVDCAYLLGRLARKALPRSRTQIYGFYHVHLPFEAERVGRNLGSGLGWMLDRIFWRYTAHCTRPLLRLLVPSRDLLGRLRERGFRRLLHVPLGVNLDLFQPGNGRNGSPVRTVLYVGRLSGEKELRVLFQAYQSLAERETGLRLVLAGDGPLRPMVEAMTRSRSDVVYHGLCPYGPELARLYAGADVLAMPGRNETFGLAVLEAMASGLPVVAARRGGPVELIPPAVGALARPGDPGDLAEKLSLVLARGPAVRRCRRHVEEHYSWDRTFNRLLEIYARDGAELRPAEVFERARRQPEVKGAVASPVPSFYEGKVL